MKPHTQEHYEVSLLDILVFFAEHVRLLIAVPLGATALMYCILLFDPEQYTARFRLELPPSVHPYVADPIFLAALNNGGPAKVAINDDGLEWLATAPTKDAAEVAVKLARNTALNAVANLDPADLSRGWNDPSLFHVDLAEQVSAVKRWAEVLKAQPVPVENDRKTALWLVTTGIFSFVGGLLFAVIRRLVRSVARTPDGAQKVARIKTALRCRRN